MFGNCNKTRGAVVVLMSRLGAKGALLLMTLWWIGCGSEPPQKPCTGDEVCGKSEICVGERCVAGCRRHDQCAPEQICRSNACTNQICKPGEKKECYEGPSESKGKGTCQTGYQYCHDTGSGWSPCYDQRLPNAEICDQQDNNCDGQVDEGLTCACEPGASKPCYDGPERTRNIGMCRAGIQYCTEKRTWGPCREQFLPRREICDGQDNDCNGLIDDQIDCECKPGVSRDCYSGLDNTADIGICKKGKQVCTEKATWGPCTGQKWSQLEEVELCNNQDDNCDGKVDNVSGTQDPLKQQCYSGLADTLKKGPCQQGIRICLGGVWSKCEGEVTPKPEECNGIDDDCNGLIDDNIAPRSCASEKSGCTPLGDGSFRCQGICNIGKSRCDQGKWGTCEGEIKPTATEICGNQQDDDCNGLIDDNCACRDGETRSCYSGTTNTRNRGECKDGTQTCRGSQWSPCQGERLPQEESCNSKDDDCDGTVDNIKDETCQIPGQPGVCSEGKYTCQNDQRICTLIAPKGTEFCNGKDDDCDGIIDNIADLGQDCTDGSRFGLCSAGKWVCDKDSGGIIRKICKQMVQASIEECNGKDDDCDGLVDNLKEACIVPNVLGVCAEGKKVCDNGKKVCQVVNQASAEICNGKDDDCNGKIDDIADLDQPCEEPSRQGICRPGRWVCQNQQKICLQLTQKQPEICNGKDDDCDGVIDPGCKQCTKHVDCSTGQICVQGYCVQGNCLSDTDCTSGQTCQQFKCGHCTQHSDCPTGKQCDLSSGKGLCKTFQCRFNTDCPSNKICDQATSTCIFCQKDTDCGTNSVCRNGLCYQQCTLDSHCSPGSTCKSGSCIATCIQSTDCPNGFDCKTGGCYVSTSLDKGAYQWSNQTYAKNCTEYRFPGSDYIGQTASGVYWIKPAGQKDAFKVVCDMEYDGGGWTLLARYRSRLSLAAYDPAKHQLQSNTVGQDVTAPPDLSDTNTYGHIAHATVLPMLKDRELRMECRTSPQNDYTIATNSSLFADWTVQDRGTAGDIAPTSLAPYTRASLAWGILAQNGNHSRSQHLCAGSTDKNGPSGLAFCNGPGVSTGNTWSNHVVSFAFPPASAGNNQGTAIGCMGQGTSKPLTDDWQGQIWVRDHGPNPIQLVNDARSWQDGTFARNCNEYRNNIGGTYTGQTGSGTYRIQPDPNQKTLLFSVFCDMHRRGGGWTLAFIKNSVYNHNYTQFGVGYYNTKYLADPPADTTLSSTARAAWLDLRKGQFPYEQFRLAVYDYAPPTDGHAGKCTDYRLHDICAYVSGAVARTDLKVEFGTNGNRLQTAPDRDGNSHRYTWCGGDLQYTSKECLGYYLSVGSGWSFYILSSVDNTQQGVIHWIGEHTYAMYRNPFIRSGRTTGTTGTAIGGWVK